MNRNTVPRPFVKWAGGKTQLLKDLEENSPPKFGTYYEPFLGGGAFFFHLYKQKRIQNAVLSDMNKDLISLYSVIQNSVDELIYELQSESFANKKEAFYKIRNDFNTAKLHDDKSILQCARLIYLNKTCFNGLYRVNSRGEFNVPFGRYKSPLILDEENLRAVSEALSCAKISHCDFSESVKQATKGDFIYFDPPYHPLTKSADFTAYTKTGFPFEQQKKLAKIFCDLDGRGCFVLESNSATGIIYNLYNEYRITEVYAIRAISSNGATRGKIPEYLISNYESSSYQTKVHDY